MSKRNIYKECCQEIVKIFNLYPNWNVNMFVKEEGLNIGDGPSFYAALKNFRELLELDNAVECSGEEIDKIINEGMHIQSVLIKEEYGEEE